MTPSRVLARAALVLALGLSSASEPPRPALRYRLSCGGDPPGSEWHVAIDGTGLPTGGTPPSFELEDWGEWTEVDSLYLRELVAEPPLERSDEARHRWRLVPPPDWDGSFRVEYTLAATELGSAANLDHGLLPCRAPTYVLGYSSNTLMAVTGAEGTAPLPATLTIEAPPGWTIATGLGGIARERLQVARSSPLGNSVISMGLPVAVARDDTGPAPVEVVQWGGEQPVANELLAFARSFVATCTDSLGTPPRDVVRLIVTEPGHGGTNTDGAIAIGCPAGSRFDEYTSHFLAHEMFHDWLGGRAKGEDESLAWFWEGFTEYASLLEAVRAGLLPRAWFARRLLDYEEAMADHARWGAVAFADPGVDWRDDGVEALAYHGSAMIAFALDLELRRQGRAGLHELLAALIARPGGEYDLAALREWCLAHGVETFWQRHLERPEPPDLRSLLAEIGVTVEGPPGSAASHVTDAAAFDAFVGDAAPR